MQKNRTNCRKRQRQCYVYPWHDNEKISIVNFPDFPTKAWSSMKIPFQNWVVGETGYDRNNIVLN